LAKPPFGNNAEVKINNKVII